MLHPEEAWFFQVQPFLGRKRLQVVDGDGRREIALLGVDPSWQSLFSEVLRVHGYSCRLLAGKEEAEAWLRDEADDFLLIRESGPGGGGARDGLVWIRDIHSAFPALRMIPIPAHIRPSELFRLIETALSLPNRTGKGGR